MRSNAAALVAPMDDWTEHALPKTSSGLEVARMTRSMSEGEMPAMSMARSDAVAAWLESVSPSAKICRFLMPVRAVIHSSVVSTSFSRSWLVRNVSGTDDPQPAIRTATGEDAAAVHCSLNGLYCVLDLYVVAKIDFCGCLRVFIPLLMPGADAILNSIDGLSKCGIYGICFNSEYSIGSE